MKKTFPLQVPGKDDARVLEAIKGDIRKYLKRERRKKFPEGFDLWDFNCKAGPDQATAAVVTVDQLIPAVDATAQAEGATQVYVEILAFASNRQPKRISPFDQPEPDAPDPSAPASDAIAAAADAASTTPPPSEPAPEIPPATP